MRIGISDYFLKARKISRSEIENKITSHKLILVESCYLFISSIYQLIFDSRSEGFKKDFHTIDRHH